MKKIVSLLAILALVFAMVAFVGCDNGNGGTPANPDSDPITNGGTSDPVGGGDDETPAGETYEVVLDGTYTANENTYGEDPNGETQVKIPTNISGLKVGDKVVLKMKGTASYEVPVMEICLADTSEAAGWWKLLADDANYTQENVTDFDIEHTFVVTAEPVTGAEIVINGKGSRNTLTFDCTAKDDDDEGGEGVEGTEPVGTPLTGFMTGTDIWGSGTSVTEADGVYTATPGTGWGSSQCSMPVQFEAGKMAGVTKVQATFDLTDFEVAEGSAEYPRYELKMEWPTNQAGIAAGTIDGNVVTWNLTETQVANAAAAFQAMITVRGTGTLKMSNVVMF